MQDLEREIDCKRLHEERVTREAKEAIERERLHCAALNDTKLIELKDFEYKLKALETELRDKEKLITKLMIAGS